MPINLQNPENISTGWPGPPQLHAPEIGTLVSAILRNRMEQQKMPLEIAKMIKDQQEAESLAKYREILGQTSQEHQRLEGEQQGYMKPYYEAKTWETYNPQFAPRGGGTPRVMRQLPNGEWAPFTPGEAYKIDTQTRATKAVGELSAQEAEAQSRAAQYEKKYGVDTESGGLKAPGMFADQATKDQFARDQAEYFKAYQDVTRVKKQRENYEKWYKGTLQPGGDQPGGQTDEEDTPLPQGGAVPVPPQAQASPSPAATPRPNAPPPADSAAGHATTYGTPASPGSGQSGDLIVGQSKRFVNGKAWTWWGDKGWLPD